MKNESNITRRHFLQTTGQTTAVLASAASLAPHVFAGKAAGETVGVGCIGLGTRGGDLLKNVVYTPGVKVAAVCDLYKPHLQKGVEGSQNPDVKAYSDYRELLADKNVEAVVIATPDHWHTQIVLDAVAAGKDIYCEKGWARTVAEAKLMRTAIKKSSVVFQLGHHARQATCAIQAKELVAQGALGQVTLVRTGRYMNRPPGQAIWRWYGYYDKFDRPNPEQVQRDVNWERWLGPAPKIPFQEEHFWHWRCYWNYGTGAAGDLLSHEMDFVQYVLGYGIPDTCMTAGLNARLKDGREVPDTWNAIYQFEKKDCTVIFDSSMNTSLGKPREQDVQQVPENVQALVARGQPVEICGQEATLRFDGIAHDVNGFTIIPESFNKKTDLPAGYLRGKTPTQPSHMQDFINCVRSRQKPKCHVDEAFIEVATYCMSIESYKRRCQVRWDAIKEEIV